MTLTSVFMYSDVMPCHAMTKCCSKSEGSLTVGIMQASQARTSQQ
jgi:hypothetical protein